MTRPDDVYGPTGSRAQEWTQPFAGGPFVSLAPGVQPPYQSYGTYRPQQAQPPYQSYGTYQPQQAHQPHPPQQAYATPWAAPGWPFPPAPVVAQAPSKPSVGKLVALAMAGFLVVGLLGGALLLITGTGSTSGAAPAGGGTAAPVVTMSLPPVIDGHAQIDNEYSRQLAATVRQQLAAVTPDPVVGLYGDAGRPPAFVVIAGTTKVGSPDLVLTALAAGFQQSLGSQELNLVDQPAGPLGGTMRCAQHSPMTTCMWSVEGAFGMNMVFQQDLAQGAATTLRVREAVETHTG